MGIPLYFRYLINNYDDIISSNKKVDGCNNLYLDLNCAIHYCCREILQEEEYTYHKKNRIEDKMIKNVIKYIELLLSYSKPKDLLFIAIDGPAPKAKMIQQRQRRFKKFYEKREIDNLKKIHNIPNDNKEEWDTNAITPGTIFMDKLAKQLRVYFLKNKNLKVIISDSNIPGEGEHKLLDHIRNNRDNNKVDVIYGLDADLIMLCMVSKVDNIYLLRETVEFDNKIHVKGYKFLYLDIDRLKNNLLLEILERINRGSLSKEENDNIIDDYIFLSFILGNDFIPHSPTVSIKGGGVDLILDIYTRHLDELKCNLVSTEFKKINHDFLKHIFRDLGLMEDSILNDYRLKRDKRNKPNKVYDSEFDRQKDLFNLYPQFNRGTEILINQGSKDWRDRYYKHIFNIEKQYEIDKICHYYLEGIFWNFHYYNFGCISWDWCYPYSQPPSFNDLYNYMNNFVSNINKLDIPKNKPIKPFEQLLMVLPQQSCNLLPKSYEKLMTNFDSDIIEYYPEEYIIDCVNKNYLWECAPKLPFIITENVKSAIKDIKLNNDEKERNKFGKIFIVN